MKIKMSRLRSLIREAIADLSHSQGRRMAGLAAGRDARRFASGPDLDAYVASTADEELLYDTLRRMLLQPEARHMTHDMQSYIEEAIAAYEALSAGGVTTGNIAADDLLRSELISATIAGLYDAARREEARRLFADALGKKQMGRYIAGWGSLGR